MADKHTKRELFETLLIFASAAGAEAWVTDGLQHEIELLDRRKGGSKGDAKKKAEQTAVKTAILAVLTEADEPMKATPIGAAVGVSVQKASALLRQMVEDKTVKRIEDKKDTFFTIG